MFDSFHRFNTSVELASTLIVFNLVLTLLWRLLTPNNKTCMTHRVFMSEPARRPWFGAEYLGTSTRKRRVCSVLGTGLTPTEQILLDPAGPGRAFGHRCWSLRLKDFTAPLVDETGSERNAAVPPAGEARWRPNDPGALGVLGSLVSVNYMPLAHVLLTTYRYWLVLINGTI